MKKINLLLLFLLLACALPAQDGISVFIGRANRYASVELSDYRKRLCLEYNISNHSLDDYYRRCGNDWGNVGIALEIARTSGKKMRDVCDYYKRYHLNPEKPDVPLNKNDAFQKVQKRRVQEKR